MRFHLRRKGIFLALGLTLLALTVLSLGVLLLNYSSRDEESITILNTLDRMHELKSSIDRGFFKIFIAKSGIEVNISNQTIEFKENMPNANNGSLGNALASFENFIENNYPQASLDLSTIINEVPLIIMPYNVTYTHKSFGGKELQIEGKGISGYTISITIQENVTGCEIEDFDAGSTNLTINAYGTFDTSCTVSQQVDPSRDTEIEIDGISDENISVELNNYRMRIRAEGETKVSSVLKFNGTEPLHIEFPDSTLSISYPDFNVNMKTGVRVI
ncbi:hypothetical protein HYV81_00725 [Candidatus Woesearchaeota archaeon]|nr:hypothetical protein [Candidatus Woesearchaeota archaeon]